MTQDLAALQQLFWESVRADPAPPSVREAFVSRGALDAEARLGIYRTAYWVRQVRALEESFPALQRHLGAERFSRAAARYVRERPSTSWALEHLAPGFCEFLEAHGEPMLAQAARIEAARLAAVIAPDAPVVSAAGVGLSRVAELVVTFGPHLTVVLASPEAVALAAPGLAGRFRPGGAIAVWRRGLEIFEAPEAADALAAFSLAARGVALGGICERLGSVQRAFAVVRGWFDRGWLSAAAVEGR